MERAEGHGSPPIARGGATRDPVPPAFADARRWHARQKPSKRPGSLLNRKGCHSHGANDTAQREHDEYGPVRLRPHTAAQDRSPDYLQDLCEIRPTSARETVD